MLLEIVFRSRANFKRTEGPLNSLLDIEIIFPENILDGVIGQKRNISTPDDHPYLFKALVQLCFEKVELWLIS
jgi:hypothetical protein